MAKTPEQKTVTRKKLTAKIVKCADLKVGDEVTGVYLESSHRPWLDRATGEEKSIPQFHFETLDQTKERFVLFGDSGLTNAMTGAGIQKGDKIAIQKLGKADIGNGRSVNQYDIFAL